MAEELERTPERLAALDQRVTGLEQGIKDVVTAVSILSNEIRQGSKTQWPVIWSAVGVGISVLSLIGAMAYFPIREGMSELRAEQRRQDTVMVPRVEHERIWAYQQRISDLNKELSNLNDRHQNDLIQELKQDMRTLRSQLNAPLTRPPT